MKKAIFLGASNTHGVSLHYFRELYNDYENVNPEWPYNSLYTDDNEKFIREKRFSAQLSKYLNVSEINLSRAGGSPAESLYILSQTDLTDVEYVIFEFSSIYSYFDRYFHSEFDFQKNKPIPRTPSEIESFLNKSNDIELKNKIIEWIINYNPYEFMNEVFIKLTDFINTNPHIKFAILIWRDALDFTNPKLQFLQKYIVKFPLLNDETNILVEKYLMENKYTVHHEFKWVDKLKLPPNMKEMHPSLNGHNKIFEILKSYIDERNTLNNWR